MSCTILARMRPSPCSPETVPPCSITSCVRSWAKDSQCSCSISSRRSNLGRTCSRPTDAWAYQTASRCSLSNRRAKALRNVAYRSSGIAQSSKPAMGILPSDGLPIRPSPSFLSRQNSFASVPSTGLCESMPRWRSRASAGSVLWS